MCDLVQKSSKSVMQRIEKKLRNNLLSLPIVQLSNQELRVSSPRTFLSPVVLGSCEFEHFPFSMRLYMHLMVLFLLFSASHVVMLLVKKYPQFNIVNFDRLDCKYHID